MRIQLNYKNLLLKHGPSTKTISWRNLQVKKTYGDIKRLSYETIAFKMKHKLAKLNGSGPCNETKIHMLVETQVGPSNEHNEVSWCIHIVPRSTFKPN